MDIEDFANDLHQICFKRVNSHNTKVDLTVILAKVHGLQVLLGKSLHVAEVSDQPAAALASAKEKKAENMKDQIKKVMVVAEDIKMKDDIFLM